MKAFVPYCPMGTLNFGYMESLNAFLGGRTAMVQQWQIEMPAQDPKQSQIVGKYAATYMPGIRTFDGSVRHSPALGGGWALGLMKDSKNKEEAFLWMMYEARPEVQKKVSLAATGVDPCRTSVYQDPEYTAKYKYLDMVGKNMAVGFALPRIPEAPTLNEMLSLALSKALAGEVTPKKALDDAVKEWYKVLEEAGYY